MSIVLHHGCHRCNQRYCPGYHHHSQLTAVSGCHLCGLKFSAGLYLETSLAPSLQVSPLTEDKTSQSFTPHREAGHSAVQRNWLEMSLPSQENRIKEYNHITAGDHDNSVIQWPCVVMATQKLAFGLHVLLVSSSLGGYCQHRRACGLGKFAP